MERSIETKCLHLEETVGCTVNYGAISYPIYQTATYAHEGVGKSTGYDYSRLQNPTREHLEKVVASLENGTDAFAFTSGMAAIPLLMEIFCPGDHIIADSDLYGGSIRLFRNVSAKNGIKFSNIDCYRENIENFIMPETKAVYIETPTNPMMNVTDIAAVSEIAKKHGLLLIVDNTFMSPYYQNPLDLGADIVVHSGTKYLGGHNDTLAGFLVTNKPDIADESIVDLLALRQIMLALPDNDRMLLELRYFKNLTQAKTAAILGITQVQVSRREKKLLTQMRRELLE